MRNDIREKLQIELNKKIECEPQVVYILSRVRKMLEQDDATNKYQKLKFYCDWALHSHIRNTGAVKEILEGIRAKDGDSGKNLTMTFEPLHAELKEFLKENQISTTLYESSENTFWFNKALSSIYTDTPLIVGDEYKVTWKGNAGERSFGGSFSVIDLKRP